MAEEDASQTHFADAVEITKVERPWNRRRRTLHVLQTQDAIKNLKMSERADTNEDGGNLSDEYHDDGLPGEIETSLIDYCVI